MAIRFKCPNCKKALGVKDHLAGRKALCPACRKALVIPKPAPTAAEVEELAAKLLSDAAVPAAASAAKPESVAPPIKFTCDFCDTAIERPFEEAGTKMPCPECKRIIRVPTPADDKPKDWRDVAKKGPSAALANQPEELENAWGSIQKRNVSSAALADAGAVESYDEPILLVDWFKRGFWTVVVLAVGTLLFFGVRRAQSDKSQKDSIETALELIVEKSVPNRDPKDEKKVIVVPAQIPLSPIWAAEIHRAAGEFYCRQRKAAKSREQLQIALAQVGRARTDKKTSGIDVDLFLIDLALTQLELGGSDDEAIGKERFYWPETIKDLAPSLGAIVEPQARSLGLRLVISRLVDKQQASAAISLAGQLSSIPDHVHPKHTSCLIAQQTALLFAQGNDKDDAQARKLLAYPELKKDEAVDPLARCAYVEGLVRLNKIREAGDLAKKEPSMAVERLEACVIAGTIIADRGRTGSVPNDAEPFVRVGLDALKEKDMPKPAPGWLVYQLVQIGLRTGAANDVKPLIKTLDPAFQAHIQLELVCLQEASATGPLTNMDEVAMTKDSFASALIIEALARHNVRLGQTRKGLKDLTGIGDHDSTWPFLLVGIALGEHDRAK